MDANSVFADIVNITTLIEWILNIKNGPRGFNILSHPNLEKFKVNNLSKSCLKCPLLKLNIYCAKM